MRDSGLIDNEGLYRRAFEAHRGGNLAEAAENYRRVLVLDPGHSSALHLSGVLAYQSDQAQSAVRLIERALCGRADVAAYYSNLGLAYTELGNSLKAVRATAIALVLDPSLPDALVNRGAACREAQMLSLAESWGRRAVAAAPAYAVAHSALGHTLLGNSKHQESLLHLRVAVVMAPANPKALFHVGLCLAHLGKPGQELVLAAAVRLMPAHQRALISLCSVHRFTEGDEWLDRLLAETANMADLPIDVQIGLSFSLAKAHEDLGQKQAGFDYLVKANTLKRQVTDYDEARTLRMLSDIREVFSRSLLERKAGSGVRSELPIFIVGMPRSGTSLVEQILASHPDVHGAGELSTFPRVLDRFSTDEECLFPQVVPDLSAEAIAEVGRDYLAAVRELDPASRFITDKLPGNLAFAGMIHLALPEARIIQLRRDPVDTCLSCFSQNFSDGIHYAYDLGELGRYMRECIELMDHWRGVLPSSTVLDVSYEALVADQEAETRRLLAFCGLPWDDVCLTFYKTERAVQTASIAQVRRPIYKNSVGRWRPRAEQLEPLLRELRGSL